jgi:hypothetical protein
MRIRMFAIAVLWALSLVGVSVWAQGGIVRPAAPGRAQEIIPYGANMGDVISGADIGFQRISAPSEPGKIAGKLVVRVNGRWLEADSSLPGGHIVPAR